MRKRERVVKAAVNAKKKLRRFFYSRLFVVITGIITILYGVAYAYAAVSATVINSNPSANSGPQFHAFRNNVIANGTPVQEGQLKGYLFEKPVTVEDKTYTTGAISGDTMSDYFCIKRNVEFPEDDYGLSLYFEGYIGTMRKTTVFLAQMCLSASLYGIGAHTFGVEACTTIAYSYGPDYILAPENAVFEPTEGHEKDIPSYMDLELIAEEAKRRIQEVASDAPKVLAKCDVTNYDQFIRDYYNGRDRIGWTMAFCIIMMILSFIAAPVAAGFFLSWTHALAEDKRYRLVCQGVLKGKVRATVTPYRELGAPVAKELPKEEPKKKIEVEELPTRSSAFEDFITKRNIRPSIGEWTVRGVGLALLGIGVICAFVGTKIPNSLFAIASPWFQTVTNTGTFILIIALVGVISETHKNLRVTASIWFTLALLYYLIVGSVLTVIDLLIPPIPGGFRFSDLFATVTSGNVFLGIGIFAILGFFLFEDPPEWFINRKVFRSLSIIPTALALLSIVFSALIGYGTLVIPSYWVRNILFVKDFEGLLVGISYEFVLFAFRSHLRRKYGSDNLDKKMEQPAIQFYKNAALCGLIIAYNIFFYSVPVVVREGLGIRHFTFTAVLIPMFLFYKPAGANHKMKDDIIYYIIYVLAMYGAPAFERLTSMMGIIWS